MCVLCIVLACVDAYGSLGSIALCVTTCCTQLTLMRNHMLCVYMYIYGDVKAQEILREAEMLKSETEKENSHAEQTLTSAKRERKRLKKELLALSKLRKKARSYRAQTHAMAYNFTPSPAIPMPIGSDASSLYTTGYTTPAGKLP